MTRNARRRTLRVESLEAREVMSAGGPSGEVQAMIERINSARANPAAAIDWALSDGRLNDTISYYGVDRGKLREQYSHVASRPPLGWDPSVAAAAQGQSDHQAAIGKQTHDGANGLDLTARLQAAGYNDVTRDAENAFAFAQSPDHAMEAFLIDWGVKDQGHMRNMLQPDAAESSLTDIGIGISKTSNAGLGPNVITVDFARHNTAKAQLLGVAYHAGSNGTYDAGEGQGNVEVDAVLLQDGKPIGPARSVMTWDASGAYQLPLDPGTYKVTASSGGKVIRTQNVKIEADNVKVDFNLDATWDGSSLHTEKAAEPAPVVVIKKAAAPAEPASFTFGANVASWYSYSNK